MSSFFRFSYDSPQFSMKLSPSCATRLSLVLLSRFITTFFFRFLFIRIVDVTRAIQWNLVSSRRLFPSDALAIVDPATLSNSIKTALSPLYNITFPHLFRTGYNFVEYIPSDFLRPFSALRLPSPYIENNSSLEPCFFASCCTMSPRIHGDTLGSEGNNF